METRAAAARRAAATAVAATPSAASAGTGASSSSVAVAVAPSASTAVASATASSAHPAAPADATRSARGKRRRDESPGAEEPKRDVAVAPTSAAAAASPASSMAASPLLRCMRGCRDIQFQLMQMLELNELAALDASCHSWREWLLHPPLVDGLDYHVESSALPSLLPCDWARPLLTSTSDMPPDSEEPPPEPHSSVAKRKARVACDELLLRVMPRFPRLHSVVLQLCNSVVSEDTLRRCFAALAESLEHLDVWPYGEDDGVLINRVLRQSPQLNRLQSLWVATYDSDGAAVDFAPLAQLPALSKFSCCMQDERPTPAQVASLVQCRSLTDIHCGSWSPQAEADSETQLQQIEQGIATLVRSRLPSAVGAEPACAPLRELDLCDTDLSAAVWEHVSQLTTLASIWAPSWRSDLTPQQWAKLAQLTQLTNLKVRPHPDDSSAPLLTEHFLPHALQCRSIARLWLGSGLRLSRAQLQSIVRQLPSLEGLLFDDVWLEDVAPLAEAASLNELSLHFCDGPRAAGDPPVQFRTLLPPLKRLECLDIYDRCRITVEQAAPLNAALLARMPLLTMGNFGQNLLPTPAPGPSAHG